MKNEVKKVWQRGGQICLFLLLMLPATIGVSATNMHSAAGYPPPEPTVTAQTYGSISFGWAAVDGATGYRGWYVKKETGYTSPVTTTGSTSMTHGNLSAGTYNFYFRSVFGSEVSDYIIIEDVIMQ